LTDRVYTFQQSNIIQDIERLNYHLSNPGSSKRIKAELFRSIQRAVYLDRGIPERLKPNVYFARYPSTWNDRPQTASIKAWLNELHKYFDDSYKRTASR
jgi:hypothetical protein